MSFCKCVLIGLALAGCVGCSDAPTSPPKSPALPKQNPLKLPGESEGNGAALALEIVPQFVNVASSIGVVFQRENDIVPGRYFLPEIMGGGAAWLDFDRDGFLDLYAANGCRFPPRNGEEPPGNHMFQNLGDGTFRDASKQTGTADQGYGQGTAVGDFDADGFPDLYVTNYGRNILYQNNGDGTFEEVSHEAGVDDPSWGTSAVWLDLNGDGDLDLYVVNYLQVTLEGKKICAYNGIKGYCGPGSYEAQMDRVYLNQNDGRFVESAKELGFETPDGKGLAVIAADFDDDKKPEIYVANDMTGNFLFTQTASPALGYHNIARESGAAVSRDGKNEASMGIACADFDGDGRVDIFLTHYVQAKNTLYRNRGGMLFDDESRRSRIAATSYDVLGFGTASLDFDRDGASDLFIANGHVLGADHDPYAMPPQLLRNDGKGHFDDVSSLAGGYFEGRYVGRGVAAADYDNDGDCDLAVTHIHQPLALLRNETDTKTRSFLGLEIVTSSRTPAVGGRVSISINGQTRSIPVTSGGSYLSSGDTRLIAGLMDAESPADVKIDWPSGRTDVYSSLKPNRYWLLIEGNSRPPMALP